MVLSRQALSFGIKEQCLMKKPRLGLMGLIETHLKALENPLIKPSSINTKRMIIGWFWFYKNTRT